MMSWTTWYYHCKFLALLAFTVDTSSRTADGDGCRLPMWYAVSHHNSIPIAERA